MDGCVCAQHTQTCARIHFKIMCSSYFSLFKFIIKKTFITHARPPACCICYDLYIVFLKRNMAILLRNQEFIAHIENEISKQHVGLATTTKI